MSIADRSVSIGEPYRDLSGMSYQTVITVSMRQLMNSIYVDEFLIQQVKLALAKVAVAMENDLATALEKLIKDEVASQIKTAVKQALVDKIDDIVEQAMENL